MNSYAHAIQVALIVFSVLVLGGMCIIGLCYLLGPDEVPQDLDEPW